MIDTLKILIFKSPIISIKEYYDNDNYVNKGILLNVYHCTDKNNKVSNSVKFKNTKYICSKNLQDFEIIVHSSDSSKETKKYVFNYENINYYYGNTKFNVNLTTDNNGFLNLKDAIVNKMITFEDIINKSDKQENDEEGNIKYSFNSYMDLIVCNKYNNSKDAIFGIPGLNIKDYCK